MFESSLSHVSSWEGTASAVPKSLPKKRALAPEAWGFFLSDRSDELYCYRFTASGERYPTCFQDELLTCRAPLPLDRFPAVSP